MMKRKRICIPAMSFVILGIINALAEKFLYEQEAIGLPEMGNHKFVKPFFFATMLFFGVSTSLVGYIILSYVRKEGYPPITSYSQNIFFSFILPGFFDMFQGIMSSITAALIGVSVDYMLRSATLVGVSLIARFYFKRNFKFFEIIGIGIVTVSLVLVGFSSILNAGSSSTVHVPKKWAAVILVLKLLSQATYSIELSLDQYYTQQRRVNVMIVSGFQSLWAFLIGSLFLIPFSHKMPGQDGNGLHENFYDTLFMLKNNRHIVFILGCCIFIEGIYQVSSVSLTESTSAVVRTLIESFRTFLIWVIQLILFYGFSGNKTLDKYRGIGEEWSKGSWLQLVAYCLLLFGLLTYRGIMCRDIKAAKRDENINDYSMLDNDLSM